MHHSWLDARIGIFGNFADYLATRSKVRTGRQQSSCIILTRSEDYYIKRSVGVVARRRRPCPPNAELSRPQTIFCLASRGLSPKRASSRARGNSVRCITEKKHGCFWLCLDDVCLSTVCLIKAQNERASAHVCYSPNSDHTQDSPITGLVHYNSSNIWESARS